MNNVLYSLCHQIWKLITSLRVWVSQMSDKKFSSGEFINKSYHSAASDSVLMYPVYTSEDLDVEGVADKPVVVVGEGMAGGKGLGQELVRWQVGQVLFGRLQVTFHTRHHPNQC